MPDYKTVRAFREAARIHYLLTMDPHHGPMTGRTHGANRSDPPPDDGISRAGHPPRRAGHPWRRNLRLLAIPALLLAAACQTTPHQTPLQTSLHAPLAPPPAPADSAVWWGAVYENDPASAEAAVQYSRQLRALGRTARSGEVMRQAGRLHPHDPAVMAELGKALVSVGEPDQALALLTRSQPLRPGDWTIPAARAVALDLTGDHAAARSMHLTALRQAPGTPSLLANLGLSHALSGNLNEAEELLRRALADPRADSRTRQNLALILALKGEFAAARRLSENDLPVEITEGNLKYLKSMMGVSESAPE